jgi:hypothetical protein
MQSFSRQPDSPQMQYSAQPSSVLTPPRSPRGVSRQPSDIPGDSTSLRRNITATFDPVDVPAEEAVFLSPMEKFTRYRVFPWKFIIHSCILVLLLTVTFAYHSYHAAYNINARFGLARAFFDVSDNTDPSLTVTFYEVDAAVQFIQQVAERYHLIPEKSPGVFMHYVTDQDTLPPEPVPPLMMMKLIRDPNEMRSDPLPSGTDLDIRYTNLTSDNDYMGDIFLHPSAVVPNPHECMATDGYVSCRNSSLPALFDRLDSAEITMYLRSVRFYTAGGGASLGLWTIKFALSFDADGSQIIIAATVGVELTDSPDLIPVVINSLLVPLVLLHLLLRLRAFQRYHIHMKELLPRWAQLDMQTSRAQRERHAGTSWKIFAIVADCICLTYIILTFVDMYVPLSITDVQIWKKFTLGLSCAAYALLYISYFQTSPEFYVLIKSLSVAVPQLTLYCVGIFPIFAAFALAAYVIVGPYAQDTFGTVQLSACTLFCVLNGDSLLQLFTQINQSDFWLLRQVTRVFMMSFLAYFYANALNVMLAIVQDSYTQVKDCFEVCRFDLDTCNEELELKHLSAAERRRRKVANAKRRQARASARFGGNSSDASETSTSSSDFSALGRGEINPKGLRALATKIQKVTTLRPQPAGDVTAGSAP